MFASIFIRTCSLFFTIGFHRTFLKYLSRMYIRSAGSITRFPHSNRSVSRTHSNLRCCRDDRDDRSKIQAIAVRWCSAFSVNSNSICTYSFCGYMWFGSKAVSLSGCVANDSDEVVKGREFAWTVLEMKWIDSIAHESRDSIVMARGSGCSFRLHSGW